MAATHLHFDCYNGISGDMTLGALVDLGAPVEAIERLLKGLPIGPFTLRAERVMRQGLAGTKVHVEVEEEPHAHRHLRDILDIVDAAGLPERAAARAKEAYRRLAEAEARVHGTTVDRIHFHEVGARDAILDVAGAMTGIELLGAETFSCAAVTTGFGMVKCLHGMMPVPAPATAELLRGLPQRAGELESELVTPTGAAILATLLAEPASRAMQQEIATGAFTPERIGYGAGDKVFEGRANYLRVLLVEAPSVQPHKYVVPPSGGLDHESQIPPEGGTTYFTEYEHDSAIKAERHTVLLLETEIDDMSPEVAGYLMDRLLADGAYDVQFSPVQMKKNRPALRVRVLADPAREAALAERLFRETSTFGLRRQVLERWCLRRRIDAVETPFGPVAVKVGLWGEEVIKASPEYEACRALAEKHGRPLSEIYDAARTAIKNGNS